MSNLVSGVANQLALWLRDRFTLKEFIETGTFRGESTEWALANFDYVLTIELDNENYVAATLRLQAVEKEHASSLDCWRGDSAELMPGALLQLDGRALIWLDAHCVAGQFGDEDACPVLQELSAINKSEYKHVILIDDAHCFHPPLPQHLTPEAWPIIGDIRVIASIGGYDTHVAHDIIILALPHEMVQIKEFLETVPAGRNALMRRLSCVATAVNGPMKHGAVPAALPAFTGMTWTNYGWMLVHRFDPNQTPALTQAGVSRDYQDIEMLSEHLKKAGYGAVFVDIGANIGAYSFGLRRFCAEVHLFEPQRIIYNMVCGSVALNGWLNVYCHNVALGSELGVIGAPNFDYNKPLSFGSIEFGSEQKEQLSQQRGRSKETVALRTLDSYQFPRIDVIKIDVEGMELDVLAGAADTIDRCRPVVFIEHGKSNKDHLRASLESMGYAVADWGVFDFICTPLVEE